MDKPKGLEHLSKGDMIYKPGIKIHLSESGLLFIHLEKYLVTAFFSMNHFFTLYQTKVFGLDQIQSICRRQKWFFLKWWFLYEKRKKTFWEKEKKYGYQYFLHPQYFQKASFSGSLEVRNCVVTG